MSRNPTFHHAPFLLGIIMLGWLVASQTFADLSHEALMADLDKQLIEQPTNGELWYRRASHQFEHGSWQGMLNDLRRAEKYAPGQFPIGYLQGRMYVQLGRDSQAIAVLDSFLTSKPNHWEARLVRARVENRQGRTEDALADFRTALAIVTAPEPDLIQEVADALATHGFTDEAVAVLVSNILRIGKVPSLEIQLIEVEAAAGRIDSALARLDSLEKSAPRPEPWMAKRAALLADAGRSEEARSAWKALVAHLDSLPSAEHDSNSMILLLERAHFALGAIACSPSASNPFFTNTTRPSNP